MGLSCVTGWIKVVGDSGEFGEFETEDDSELSRRAELTHDELGVKVKSSKYLGDA